MMVRLWGCPSGDEWDRFLLDPGMPEHDRLSGHLASCPHCRFVVAERKRGLAELQAAWDGSAPHNIIILRPIEEFAAGAGELSLLAAKGAEPAPVSETVTLASPDNQVFLRAVRDAHSQDVWLYLVSEENPALCRHVLLKPFGSGTEYVTDSQGRVNIGRVPMPESADLQAEVHLPTAVFTLLPLTGTKDRGVSHVIESPGGDQVRVTWSQDDPTRRLEIEILKLPNRVPDVPLKVAVRRTDDIAPPHLRTASTDLVTIESVEPNESLEIYFFQ